jgi:hypothetical protein
MLLWPRVHGDINSDHTLDPRRNKGDSCATDILSDVVGLELTRPRSGPEVLAHQSDSALHQRRGDAR